MSEPAANSVPELFNAIQSDMAQQGIDLLLAFHDGAHFIEKPNAVMVLSGFKPLGHALAILPREGEATIVVTPSWDLERAADSSCIKNSAGADDIVSVLADYLARHPTEPSSVATAGLASMPWVIEQHVTGLLGGKSRSAERIVFGNARRKNTEQIARARQAAEIAEKGYQRLLEIARSGMREDELAVELQLYMKSLGAEDNFLMLCAGPHNRAVQPSSGRRLEPGDIILAEITPSYRGQMAQICRTAVLGNASNTLRQGYDLVVDSMKQGIAAARPGATIADVCRAIDSVLEAKGYGEFCRPPHIRRRGHGLGFGSNLPGDVSVDNPTPLEAEMFFVIHPNQYLPETGYLLCGEPVLITAHGPELLSQQTASVAEIAI
jgi:Xaa-Pro aminopeptidase